MADADAVIADGVDARLLDDALRLLHDALSAKFRLGFRDAGDLVRLFRDSADTASCLSATADGRLLGVLTFQTADRDFYRLRWHAPFTRFSPLRALRMLANLALLDEDAAPGEFIVASVAVDPAARGLGVGTRLMQAAGERAATLGAHTMSLGVLGDNEGAFRLYERLGYRTVRTERGFLVRLATGSAEVHRMERPVPGAPPPR